MNQIETAMHFALSSHTGQTRKRSGIPYFTHCVEVMKRVSTYGIRNENVLSAAILHDVVEDCPEQTNLLLDEFGPTIFGYVVECSRKTVDNATLQQKLEFLQSFSNKSIESIIIKIADRYCNVQDYLLDEKKVGYASFYSLQAEPLFKVFIKRVRNFSPDLDVVSHEAQKKILFDIMELRNITKKGYPHLDSLEGWAIERILLRGY